ncbi:unnamed protein product [Didymodactylos carnosus]|uniref:N-acetyltransferase domain-containing protein n=1 Tax=Didymodactylos carnosus TaxID=1234261 RepID=A0A814I571_9BILA|nr:unnamed protein product [Didymodactylos carnosus]CAF1018452.1 unnamed protein product [Didymodactylos carnosus]CAF3760569.1 unnamed protein product [Didymodactylos carnosus]CAF3789935.1 unnamed protein product [Didymodactylos carnosus]
MSAIEIIRTTDNKGVINPDTLKFVKSCYSLHKQLHPNLLNIDENQYIQLLQEICLDGHSHFCIILKSSDNSQRTLIGLCLYRYFNNTFNVIKFDVLDMFIIENERNRGYGTKLMTYLIDEAKKITAPSIVVQCNVDNTDAQRFFFRHNLRITTFGFSARNLDTIENSQQSTVKIIKLTDDNTGVIPDSYNELLLKAEPIHHQLRTMLKTRNEYIEQIKIICQTGPAHIALALIEDVVVGVTMYRMVLNMKHFKHFYCDDLVTDETKRGSGVGHVLMNHLKQEAKFYGADKFTLDSGCQRQQAHRYYYKEGLVIDQFGFSLNF